MTTSIRYGSYTNAQAVAAIDAVQRSELAFEAIKVVTPVIATGANGNIYTIKAPGKIQAILTARITNAAGQNKPDIAGVNAYVFVVSADGKSVNLAVPAGGTATLNTDIAYLTLAVGY